MATPDRITDNVVGTANCSWLYYTWTTSWSYYLKYDIIRKRSYWIVSHIAAMQRWCCQCFQVNTRCIWVQSSRKYLNWINVSQQIFIVCCLCTLFSQFQFNFIQKVCLSSMIEMVKLINFDDRWELCLTEIIDFRDWYVCKFIWFRIKNFNYVFQTSKWTYVILWNCRITLWNANFRYKKNIYKKSTNCR